MKAVELGKSVLIEKPLFTNSKHFKKYQEIREPNLHKMKPIPVCILPKD